MGKAWLLLLALVLVLHAALVAAAPACAACHDVDCPASLCAHAGCLPSALPGLPSAAPLPLPVRSGAPPASPSAAALPEPAREVWTPPD